LEMETAGKKTQEKCRKKVRQRVNQSQGGSPAGPFRQTGGRQEKKRVLKKTTQELPTGALRHLAKGVTDGKKRESRKKRCRREPAQTDSIDVVDQVRILPPRGGGKKKVRRKMNFMEWGSALRPKKKATQNNTNRGSMGGAASAEKKAATSRKGDAYCPGQREKEQASTRKRSWGGKEKLATGETQRELSP